MNKVTYFWLYTAKALVLITGFLVFRWANTILGDDSFSEYAMSRRTISLLAPAMVLGLGVGLPRCVAMLAHNTDERKRLAYFWSGFSFILFSNAVIVLLALFIPRQAASLFFAGQQYSGLIFPIALSLVGLSWHGLIWAYLCGRFLFRVASILEVVNLVIIPILAFSFFNDSISQLLAATGSMVIGVCFLVVILWAAKTPWQWSGHWEKGRELLSYGLPRVPGDFALGGLIAIPSMVTAHMFGLEMAGYVAFGSTMLNLAGTAVSPLSTALLPSAAKLISTGSFNILEKELKRLCLFAGGISIVGVLCTLVWMPKILELYLGQGFAEAVPVLRGFAFCVLPYIQFVVMRNVVDAAHHKPVNTVNVIIALLVFCVATFIFVTISPGLYAILGGVFIGHSVLFILTFIEIRKIFKTSDRDLL